MSPLLSILIPTFNRSEFLERLLANLEAQLVDSACSQAVEVLISDNASDDNTEKVLNKYKKRNPSWLVKINATNIGPELNMLSLLENSCGKYRWVLGDDDLPVLNIVPRLLSLLSNDSPSLVYLPSEWAADISQINADPIGELNYNYSSPLECARELNIWITFISSWIFNSEALFSGLGSIESISKHVGSSFLPLGWLLPLFVHSKSSIIMIKNKSVLATSGNSGGYSVIHAFMVNYPEIIYNYTTYKPEIRHALLEKPLASYMPQLILAARFNLSSFKASNITKVFLQSVRLLWMYLPYWIFCVPALFMPRVIYISLRRAKNKIKCLI